MQRSSDHSLDGLKKRPLRFQPPTRPQPKISLFTIIGILTRPCQKRPHSILPKRVQTNNRADNTWRPRCRS
jgi:hypothetical protein